MRRWFSGLAMAGILLCMWQPHVVDAGAQVSQQSHLKEPPLKVNLQDNPGDYVGSETCATCHAAEAKKFDSNPHAKLSLEHAGKGVTCESCHGAGKAHVESGGDKTKIFSPATATAKQVDATCLGCHQGQHANFERSEHGKAKVSCVSCHSVHASQEPEHLLKVAQPQLCFQCHTDVKSQFAMPFHHKVEEGLMKCSDCHSGCPAAFSHATITPASPSPNRAH